MHAVDALTGDLKKTVAVKLIVGADGLVGRALFTHFKQAGERVIGTTRRKASVDESRVYLDLDEDIEDWALSQPVDVAIICGGVTKLDACRQDSQSSARVNVEGIPALAKKLAARGSFVVYLSTNQVFDGSEPHHRPDDPLSPVTEYGRQKAEAERLIGRLGERVAIVRFTKILEPKNPLLSAWSEKLRNGQTIHPFSDMRMAPVPLACAVSVLRLVVDRRLAGIIQVSGADDLSYAEAACIGAQSVKADLRLVEPVKASQLSYREFIPAHTTLSIDRLRSVLGIEPPPVPWTIKMAF